MFTNNVLGEIFLINSHTNTIHAASTLSDDCGINGTQNGRFGILPCASARERELMLQQFGIEYPQLALCPHCFARELAAQRAQQKAQAEEGQKGEASRDETPKEEGLQDETPKDKTPGDEAGTQGQKAAS